MPEYPFALICSGVGELTTDIVDALVEAGCHDATFGQRAGVSYAEFDREATSAAAALRSAAAQVESVDPLRVHHAEPSAWVSLGEIARRTGRTRESIRQLALGERGPGGFPTPVCGVLDRTRLWRWSEVVDWWNEVIPGDLPAGVIELAHAIERFNAERAPTSRVIASSTRP